MGNTYKTQQFLDAIPGTGGIITAIAKRLGCSWHTAKKRIEESPTLKAAYEDECQSILDLAEVKLFEAIRSGDLQAVKYILSTKGKARGYTERHEVTGEGGGPLEVKAHEWDSKTLASWERFLLREGDAGVPNAEDSAAAYQRDTGT